MTYTYEYLFYTNTVHESLVSCLSSVPKKMGINQKLYSNLKKNANPGGHAA